MTKKDLDITLEKDDRKGATLETGGPGGITLLENVYSSRFFMLLRHLLDLDGLPIYPDMSPITFVTG